jgi:hypothetical protein
VGLQQRRGFVQRGLAQDQVQGTYKLSHSLSFFDSLPWHDDLLTHDMFTKKNIYDSTIEFLQLSHLNIASDLDQSSPVS